MSPIHYIYELRESETVIATGHLRTTDPYEVGQRMTINDRDGLIQSIEPTLNPREQRVVIQLTRPNKEEGRR